MYVRQSACVIAGGIPSDYYRIFDIVENKKHLFKATSAVQETVGRVAICMDTAHAFESSWRGKMVGSIVDFSSFSFHAVNVFETEVQENDCKEWIKIAA